MYHGGPVRLFSPAIAYRDRTREKEIQLKARTFILTTCVAFALVVPAAQAASTTNALYQARLHTILFDTTHQVATKKVETSKVAIGKRKAIVAAKTRSQVRQSVTPVPEPAAPGTGVPILATTNDDYDNQQVLYGTPAPNATPPAADSSGDTSTAPPLLDGYLSINQVN
jgi:hypothetical protein